MSASITCSTTISYPGIEYSRVQISPFIAPVAAVCSFSLPALILKPGNAICGIAIYLSCPCSARKVELRREHRENIVVVSTHRADEDLGKPGERSCATCSAHHGADLDGEVEVR
jgi:hypothetical protein